jgi:ribonuclease D
MSHIHVQSAGEADGLVAGLAGTTSLALDCEAAGFHRYSDRLCLVQLSTERATWVIDPLAFDPSEMLRRPLEDPSVTVVMHGADFDLRLLRRCGQTRC